MHTENVVKASAPNQTTTTTTTKINKPSDI